MIDQKNEFLKKYPLNFDEINAEDLENFKISVDNVVDQVGGGREYTIANLKHHLKINKNKVKYPKNYNDQTFAYLLTLNKKMRWHDCGCGRFGKFRKVHR